MNRLLLIAFVASLGVLAGCGQREPGYGTAPGAVTKAQVEDPVCKRMVDVDHAFTYDHQGRTYSFCSEKCRQKFKEDAKEYVK